MTSALNSAGFELNFYRSIALKKLHLFVEFVYFFFTKIILSALQRWLKAQPEF
jgi:hypothetical protein